MCDMIFNSRVFCVYACQRRFNYFKAKLPFNVQSRISCFNDFVKNFIDKSGWHDML